MAKFIDIKMGLANMPDREGTKLPYTLKAFQVPINTNIHAIPVIE